MSNDDASVLSDLSREDHVNLPSFNLVATLLCGKSVFMSKEISISDLQLSNTTDSNVPIVCAPLPLLWSRRWMISCSEYLTVFYLVCWHS